MYSLYLGCIVPNLLPEVELSVRRVLRELEVYFEDMMGASCCLPPALFGFNEEAWLGMNERNMKLANHDVLTVCDECFASMQDARGVLSKRISDLPEVVPLVKLLAESVGKLKEAKKFEVDVRCAIQHSCHLLRPSKVRGVDDARSPRLVRSVLEAIGCEVISYEDELSCCGGSICDGGNISKQLALRKLGSVEASGAKLIVTTCPHCLRQLSAHSSKLPVIHLAQLCALALGSPSGEIGLSSLEGALRHG